MFWGYFLVVLSAACFGFIPIFALYAYGDGVNTTTLLFLRFTIATLIFFTYLFLIKKSIRIAKKQLLTLILLGGVLYMMQSTFYFSSVKFIPSAMAALLFYLYPIFVAILSFFVNKEKLSKQLVLAIAIALVGILFVLGTPKEHINLVGVLFASGAAVVYSVYIIIGDHVTKELPSIITSAFVVLFSALSFFIGGMVTNTLQFHFGKVGLVMIICVAFFCTVVAIFTFFAGMNMIGPTKASILSMVEPVVTFIMSTVIFHDQMSIVQLIGGAAVLIGAVLVVIARKKRKEEFTSGIAN